jgi:hypothetical protein
MIDYRSLNDVMISTMSDIEGALSAELNDMWEPINAYRRRFIGGSDARIIMGADEGALIRLWREKRSALESEDPSGNLVVQLGLATRDLNRRWRGAIARGVPFGWYIVTVCYAIAVISLGWYPWNFLLVGLLFLIRNKPLRERALVWFSSRVRMLIGLPDKRVSHSTLNSMKTQ